MHFYYRVFGMHVRSEVEFPELVESTPEEWASDPPRQVVVELGETPDTLNPPKSVFDWVEAGATETLFHVRGRGKIFVSQGRTIIIQLDAADKLIELRPYMITCGFATAAFHRHWLPLHVGAVRSPKGVILFCGPSGAGKSTTTTAVAKHLGWDLLSDDMVVVEPISDPIVHIGVKRIKLWANAAKALGVDVTGLEQDFFRPFKYHARIDEHHSFPHSHIVGVIRLVWGEELSYRPKSQAFALQELINSLYPTYFRDLYIRAAEQDACLRKIFPLKVSGVLARNSAEDPATSLAKVTRRVRDLVE